VGDLDRLLRDYPAEVIETARPLREKLLARGRDPREQLSKLATELPAGDAARGKELFFSSKATCARCHRAAGKGGTVGPNLSRIAVIRDRPELLESIVLPSAYVAPEFRAFVITTTDGGLTTGLIVQETSDAIYLRRGDAPPQRIARERIEDVMLSPTSLMPEGFDRALSRQELSDLVEFLANLR
jgi:putative heme-binding domain-containing protein